MRVHAYPIFVVLVMYCKMLKAKMPVDDNDDDSQNNNVIIIIKQ